MNSETDEDAPWRLVQSETWPFPLRILSGGRCVAEFMLSHSTADKRPSQTNRRPGNALIWGDARLIVQSVNARARVKNLQAAARFVLEGSEYGEGYYGLRDTLDALDDVAGDPVNSSSYATPSNVSTESEEAR